MIITYRLDGRPQAWQRATGKGGSRFTPTPVREAKKAHRQKAGPLLAYACWDRDGLFKLGLDFFFAPPRRVNKRAGWTAERLEAAARGSVRFTNVPDVDNLIKLVCDALNPRDSFPGAWSDDRRVVEVRAAKWYHAEPHTIVTIERIG